MKRIFFLILTSMAVGCTTQPIMPAKTGKTPNRLKIEKVTQVGDHFIFQTKSDSGRVSTIIAEIKKVGSCRPFKQFIIGDSLYNEIHLYTRSSDGKILVDDMSRIGYINDIPIHTDDPFFIKMIWNCDCFTDE